MEERTSGHLAFEDFTPGETVQYGDRLVTRDEIVEFAREFDPQPFHLDEAAARETMLGGLAASGWHMCAILMRLNCDGFLLRATSMGAPGIDEVKWLRPLRPGARVFVRRTVLDARASKSRPSMGLVKFLFELVNGDGDVLMTQEGSIMFGRRSAPE
jgi:acyl dehydratase